uniref:ribosomal protein S3 n=1 Tax=Zygnema cf. cylindricum TaxID=3142258 RepID=UPI0031F45267
MAQKVNPIAVRLKFNRNSDSSWFSDYYYATFMYQDCNVVNYFSTIRQPTGNKLGFRPGRCVIHHYPKRSVIHLFCLLSSQSNTLTSIIPMKVTSVYQSASLVAQEICCKLEQTKSFRQICRTIFKQIEMCNYIKGIRIACSGRLNGAEIAKTECKQYGETSLHVFSDQIDYAYTKASTPYGILGVKVWICYL